MFVLFRRQTLALSRRQLRVGVVLGVLYGVAQVLQTTGLQHTDASVSGFITGTYVVLTPVLGAVLLHDRIGRVTWVAVGLATVGLALLSLQGFSVGIGEALTLLSAVLYAGHIVALGRWSTPGAAVGLATVQAGVITVVAAVVAVPDGLTLPADGRQWASLLYMALVAGALALWAQTWAQAHLTGDPRGDRHGARAGLRRLLRGDPRRREPDPPDARRGRARRGGDVPRRAAVDAARPHGVGGRRPTGRGAPPRRLSRVARARLPHRTGAVARSGH